MTKEELSKILSDHALWLTTDGDEGSRANLNYENLREFDLRDADLEQANFEGANLKGANLSNGNLSNANFEGANLVDADLGGADLRNADLTRSNLKLARLYYADLKRAYLAGADLGGANLERSDLSGANLLDANLEGAHLGHARLGFSDLDSANLKGADLRNAHLKGADLRNADLQGANLEGANLERAKLGRADLRDADLRNAILEGAILEGANLEGANLEGANLEFTMLDVPEELTAKVATGKQTRALSKLKKQALPLKAAAFKKLFPEEFERIKAETKGADFTPQLLQQLIDKYGIVWSVSKDSYQDSAQRICDNANEVLQLNIDISDPVYTEQQKKNLKAVKQVSLRSEHPVVRGGNIFTIGWVRYCDFPDRILVEEVQSDVPGVRKGLKDPDFRQQLESSGVFPEELEETLALLAPFADRFYEDALGLVFDLAEEQGKRVEMFDYAQKKQFGSPRAVYTDLPRSMGMKLGPSEAMPDIGQVWKYTPNRKRRAR